MALSELWLDTELSAEDLQRVARVMADSDLSIAQLRRVYLVEVAAAVSPNRNIQCDWTCPLRRQKTGRCLQSMNNINSDKKELSPKQREELLRTLKGRFEQNMNRHKEVEWAKVQAKLETNAEKLWSLKEMERIGGEPDVVGHDKKAGEYIFCDCSSESPKGRRSLCYDREALESRKEHKPENSAIDMAAAMGIELLTEEQYRELQKLGNFDTKTSSWVKTPSDIRKLGGAIFCDRRYNTVFVYHNGAESYYAAMGFRGSLRI